MDILLPEFKELLLLLNKYKVNYMLIGGYAVIYYGYERSTTDMDIWLKPDNENRDKLLLALKAEEKVNYFPLKDEKVPIIHYNHLILSKICNERPQDKADVDRLQKINQFKKKKD